MASIWTGCSKVQLQAQLLKKETLISRLEFVRDNGEVVHMDGFISIYYLKDLVMYENPDFNEYSKVDLDKNGDFISDTFLKNDTSFRYFIHKYGDETGIQYDSLTAVKGKIFPLDSLLKIKAFKGMNFYDVKNERLVSKEKIVDTMVQRTIPRVKFDLSYPDSSYYYYSKSPTNLVYSFSKYLDSTRKNHKLFKVRIVYKPTFDKAFKIHVPRREFYFEIKEDTIRNRKLILALFKRFSKDVSPSNK